MMVMVVGIGDTRARPSCRHYSNCVRYAGGKYDVVYGRDEAMLGGLATGAKAR